MAVPNAFDLSLGADHVADVRSDFVIRNVGWIFVDLCDDFISYFGLDHLAEIAKHRRRRNYNKPIKRLFCRMVSEHGRELASEKSFEGRARITPWFDRKAGTADRVISTV